MKSFTDPAEEAFIQTRVAELQRVNAENDEAEDSPRDNPVIPIEKPTEIARAAETPAREAPRLERRPSQPPVPVQEKAVAATVITDTEQPLPEIIEITNEDKVVPSSEYIPPKIILPTEEVAAFSEPEVSTEPYAANQEPNIEPVPAREEVLLITEPVEIEVLPAGEVIVDQEVMATFEQLAQLTSVELEEEFVETAEPYENFIQDSVILLNPEAIEPVETNAFEQFLVERLEELDTNPDIETIMAGADSQPLEETLAQLSFYLADLAETETAPEQGNTAIQEALQAVIEVLPSNSVDYAAETEDVAITPELTQKLLIFLEAAGYSNPREALVEFVGQHDLEFLTQAIRHLYQYQLGDDINRHEFLMRRQTFTAMTTGTPLAGRLGRAIMQYFFVYKTA